MYLKIFKQMAKCCLFDVAKGCGGDLNYVENKKTSGFCCKVGEDWVSVYPRKKSLVVQINRNCWNLFGEYVEITYYHQYDSEETVFEIEDGDNKYKKVYKSWWSGREDFDVNPFAASEEEENSQEDVFGYIYMLKNNHESASNLHSLWLSNL